MISFRFSARRFSEWAEFAEIVGLPANGVTVSIGLAFQQI
jgi:hypothetical protein